MWTLIITALSGLSAQAVTPGWVADPAPQLRGPLGADAVRDGLIGVSAELRLCYAALLQQHPTRRGPLTATFAVGANGLASEISSAGEAFPEAWFHGCVADALADARYPTAPTPTAVSWTLSVDRGLLGDDPVLLAGTGPQLDERPVAPNMNLALTAEPTILGAMDVDRLRAVIDRHREEFTHCYSAELTRNPSLAGKVTTKFVIARDGTVSSATTRSTTLNSPPVEDCVNHVFMGMQFPEPRGGGIVIINYPFVFSPG